MICVLLKFKTKNFKNFRNEIVLDLSQAGKYEFNDYLIKDGVIRGGVIFGKNGSGKSNLGYALFDIVNHLTDKEKTSRMVDPYINLDSENKWVEFEYTFKFDDHLLKYHYVKFDPDTLIYEKMEMDGSKVIEYDYSSDEGFCNLKGTESLNLELDNNRLSFVKYINNNSILEKNDLNNSIFKKFVNFVDNMLLFYSLDRNTYIGYKSGSESIGDVIVKMDKLKDFENFLKKLEIDCNLISREVDGKFKIFNKFEHGEADFFTVASTGTRALTLFYYWFINSDEASLIFMDEFDAYYHFELSEEIVSQILQKNIQIIFTSHNTNLMDNSMFRPDCLFILQENRIQSMGDLTDKELRKAHNLQKMYKAGAFHEK